MKMEWVPYFPLEKRDREIDRMNFQILCFVCTQRRAALRHLKEDRVMKFQYCLPYFNQHFEEDEVEKTTVVDILFPTEPGPVFVHLSQDFVDDLIGEERLSAEQKDEFKKFVKEQVRAAKKAFREAKACSSESNRRNERRYKGSHTKHKVLQILPSAFTRGLRNLKAVVH